MTNPRGATVVRAWQRLPAIVRAPVAAFVVLNVGSTLGVLPVLANTRLLPAVPWALAATSLLMWGFWWHVTGGGPPAVTQSLRRQATRERSLPGRVWRAAIAPLLLALVTIVTLRLLLPSLLPVAAPRLPLDVASFPPATILGWLLAVAITAGVAEEVALRGYLQKPLEDRYGVAIALVVAGIAFWLAHLDKVTLSHLPFHLVASVLLGLAAYLTRSLLPAMAGHFLADALLLPAYVFRRPDLVWSSLVARPIWEGQPGVGGKLWVALRAMRPAALFEEGPARRFAVLAWLLLASSAMTWFAFVRLASTTRARGGEPPGS